MIRLRDGRLVERIETVAEFLTMRDAIEPVYVASRTHGQILVPCMNTLLVRVGIVVENLYNPNHMVHEKMLGLRESMLDNGVCFPVVAICDEEQARFVISDGAHRYRMHGPEWLDCDYIPVVVLPHDMSKRIIATWQFNKVKGHHQIDLDAELIRRLIEQGLSDEEIAQKLAIDVDTVYRYKQVTGVAELFKNATYSGAWEMADEDDRAAE